MKALVIIDIKNNQVKKSGKEAVSYAAQFAHEIIGLVLGQASGLESLGECGCNTVLHDAQAAYEQLDGQQFTQAILQAVQQTQASVVIFSNNNNAKAIAPRVAVKLNAGLVMGAVSHPNTANGFVVKKSVFSGKAFCNVNINTDVKVIAITPNSFPINTVQASATVQAFTAQLSNKKINVTAVNQVTGKVPLPEAELVVSGGRGLKGPENWGILEELATSLGAELACSRPVADSHWRPHHEHVGQTGGTIRPNLYIAVGISGAIQHLAGVNGSKTIVVINKDEEAPFFKAADYGICADAFEVLPKLTEAVKKYKASLS
jgi:electron transfer flavoprotein alpha subunit